MKQAQYNPLVRELRRAETPGPHPLEDVLTAFAENTLLERERLEMVEHLSRCGSCREVLSLATATVPEAAVPASTHISLPRPRLRGWVPWAIAAAAMVVVSSAGLIYENGAQLGGAATRPAALARTEATPSPGERGPQGVATGEGESRPPASLVAPQSSVLTAGLTNGAGVRAHWRIDEAGQVERSVDGTTWQAALPDERATMHVVWVSDSNVWVAGQGLSLFRSGDEGATWQRVLLPNKEAGAHAIAHIRFQSDRVGTVEADDGTRWSTIDGGQSWK